MKKYLIFSIAFTIMPFAGITNVSAASISNYSMDVTVGEVDGISTDDENQDIHTPETGLFGLGSDNAAPIIIASATPIVVVSGCIFVYIHRKHAK